MKSKKIIFVLLALVIAVVLTLALVSRCSVSNEVPSTPQTPVDTTATMLTLLRNTSRLYTTEVKIHKIITHHDQARLKANILGKDLSMNLPTGERRVAIPLYATLKASIDMSQLTADDVVRTGDYVEIYLPHPEVEITETHIDHQGVKRYVPMLRSDFTDEELQTYERKGRSEIEGEIPRMQLNDMARENAAKLLIPLVRSMGFDEDKITISFRNDGRTNVKLIRKKE